MTPRELSIELSGAQASFIASRLELKSKHLWEENDARLTAFNKCIGVLTSALTSTIFVERHLTQEAWWMEHGSPESTDASIQVVVDGYWMFQRIGLLHGLFYALESSFRNYASAMKLNIRRGDGFGLIYPKVLSATGNDAFLPFLDLFRLSRNLMHTNGIYDPPSAKDQDILFEGNLYAFKAGQLCPFVDERLLVRLISASQALLLAVVQSKPLMELTHIQEPTWPAPERAPNQSLR